MKLINMMIVTNFNIGGGCYLADPEDFGVSNLTSVFPFPILSYCFWWIWWWGDIYWLNNNDGKINALFNCIDRHLATHKDKVAIIWEEDGIHCWVPWTSNRAKTEDRWMETRELLALNKIFLLILRMLDLWLTAVQWTRNSLLLLWSWKILNFSWKLCFKQ